MTFRLILLMVLAGLLICCPVIAGSSLSPCLMRPPHIEMRLPLHGFTRLDGDDIGGRCDQVPFKNWIRKSSGSLDLFVYANGPSGSGRYWNVSIAVARKRHSKPVRGVCLETSTVGWRTLQQYKKTPLAWLDDLDKDGNAELILWNSFPIREIASQAEYGLMAWVYRPDSKDALAIDWNLSRRMARDIAGAYRSTLETTGPSKPIRIEAAEALEQFAGERCAVPQNHARQ